MNAIDANGQKVYQGDIICLTEKGKKRLKNAEDLDGGHIHDIHWIKYGFQVLVMGQKSVGSLRSEEFIKYEGK